jgi:hypothetical protein
MRSGAGPQGAHWLAWTMTFLWMVSPATLALAEATAAPQTQGVGRTRTAPAQQVHADELIGNLFPDSDEIRLGIAFVPDPRVPRHRRGFDIAIEALTSGMLDAGYVLDRFMLPWTYGSANEKTESGGTNAAASPDLADDGRFGLLVFRDDCWRDDPEPANSVPSANKCATRTRRVVALYLVPETVSYGVPSMTFSSALDRVQEQICDAKSEENQGRRTCATALGKEGAKSKVSLLQTTKLDGCSEMVLLGPTFSGSLDSIARVLHKRFGDSPSEVCTLSASATAETNTLVEDYGTHKDNSRKGSVPTSNFKLTYHSLAVSDKIKFETLSELARKLDASAEGAEQALALLCEDSVFGSGLCDSSEARSSKWIRMRFPANIADIRFRYSESERKAESELPADVSALSRNLHLDEGAENGSEFPDSQQSPLTAASSELKLDSMLKILAWRQPRVIAVAATDVRDRLFLFDQIRARVPGALLVDMEADVLLSHPDFLHASRGIVMLASHQLRDMPQPAPVSVAPGLDSVRSPMRSYATDYEALMIKAVSRVVRGIDLTRAPVAASEQASSKRTPCLTVTARGGPRRAFVWDWGWGWGSGRDDWVSFANDDGLCWKVTKKSELHVLDWFPSWSCIVAILATLGILYWLTRRCDAWVHKDKWTHATVLQEFAPLPVAAALLVYFTLPDIAPPWQGVRNFLVVCTVLAPLLAIHRAAARACAENATGNAGPLFTLGDLQAKIRSLSPTARAILLAPAVLDLGFIVVALLTWLVASLRIRSAIEVHWLRLAMDAGSGFGLLPALGTAMAAILFGLGFIGLGVYRYTRNTSIMKEVAGDYVSHESATSLLVAMYAALLFALARSQPLALSIFGSFASFAVCLAEVVLVTQAIMCIAWAVVSWQRARSFAVTLYWSLEKRVGSEPMDNPQKPDKPVTAENATDPDKANASKADENKENKVKDADGVSQAEKTWAQFWNGWTRTPVILANTPFAASLQAMVEYSGTVSLFCDDKEQAKRIKDWIEGKCGSDCSLGGWAIYRLLVSEVSSLRWSAFCALFSCLALVVLVYAFPAPGADNFLLLGLGLMLLAGLITAYAVVSLERSKCISRVLCNTSEKSTFSWTYFGYLMAPVLLLAIAIAIVDVPGVMVWGNGLMALLKYIGVWH